MAYQTVTTADGVHELGATAEKAYDNARTSRDLTPAAKQRAIAVAYQQATDSAQALKDAADGATANSIATLSRSLFGLPSNATSSDMEALQSAQDRVSAYGQTSTAIAALNNANLVGNTIMIRAILGAAFANRWPDVINQYVTLYPADQNAAEQLWSLMNDNGSGSNLVNVWAYLIPTPPELAGLSPWSITELATSDVLNIQVLS